MRGAWILVAVLLGCGAEEAVEPVEPVEVGATDEGGETTPPDTAEPGPVLEADVEAVVLGRPMFAGWTVVPLAQLTRGDRIVVAVWPALDPSGQVVDDDIIGVTLQRAEGALSVVAENWAARSRGSFVQQLGGEAEQIRRGEGVPHEQLADLLRTLPVRFAELVRAGDRAAARDIAIVFSRLFDFELGVANDTVTELLAAHAAGTTHIETEPGRREGDQVVVRARFFQGEQVAEEEDLIATAVGADPTRWVFSGHRRIDAGAL